MAITIPLKFIDVGGDGFHLHAIFHIGKKPVRMVIDTGASRTVFDKQKFESITGSSDSLLHEKLSAGIGGSGLESHVIRFSGFRLGKIELKKYQTVLMDLSHVNNSYAQMKIKEVDGILGSDIMKKFKAKIDFGKKVLVLYPPKKKSVSRRN
jgi:hypothetical protein